MAANSQVLLGLYAAIYVRSPDQAGYKFWTDGFALPAPTTLTTRGAATAFSARTEWATAYPTTLSDTAYVDKIYLNVLGIAGDANGRKFWTDLITAKTVTRTDFVADFIAATIDYNSTTDTTSTAAEKTAALGAQATIQAKVTFSETWVANTAVSGNSTITGVDSTGGYIASIDKSVALLAGVTDAASLATQTPKIAAAAAAGTAFTLTTGTDTFTALTALNDSITGGNGTLGGDVIIDNTSTDADVLTATSVVATTKPTITKVETINVSNSFSTGLDVSSVSGATTLNLSATVANGNATVTAAKVGAVTKIVAGTNISTLTVETAAAGTGGDLGVDAGSATTVNLKGEAGTDSIALTTTGNVAIKATTANVIETLKLTANPVAVTGTATATAPVVTLDNAGGALGLLTTKGTLEVASTGDLEIKANIADIAGRTVTKGAGKLTLTLSGTAATADLTKVVADTISLGADLGTTNITVNDGTTIATPVTQTDLALSTAALATLNNTAATQTKVSSTSLKALTINSAAPALTGVDATYANIDLSGTAGAAFPSTKVTFTGGTATAGQDVKVTSGKVETVDASKLLGTVDYTADASGVTTLEKFNFTGSAGADKLTIGTSTVKAAITASLGDGDDTVTLPAAIVAGSTFTIDGGVGTADTLSVSAGTDFSGTGTVLTLTNVENIAFSATAGGIVTFTAAQLLAGQTYSIKGSTGTADNLTVVGTKTTTAMDASKLTLDTAVETVTLNGANGTVPQTLTGVFGTSSLKTQNSIAGGAAADIIVGGGSNDTITGNSGADTVTGNGGVDTFIYASGDTGTASATVYDVITDFTKGTDLIQFTGAANIAPTNVNLTAAAGKAAITPNSVATFVSTETTLAQHLTSINATLGTAPAAGTSVVWSEGSDTFLLVKGASDVLVKLGTAALNSTTDTLSTFIPTVIPVSLTPTPNSDFLSGPAAGTTFDALAGADTLVATGGNNTFTGGAGADGFVVNSGATAAITDFSVDADTLSVAAGGTASLTAPATPTLWAPTGVVNNSGTVNVATLATSTGIDLSKLTGTSTGSFAINAALGTGTLAITGTSGNDAITLASGGTIVDTVNVTAGTDTIVNFASGGADVLNVSAGATAVLTPTGNTFTLTSTISNAGTVTINALSTSTGVDLSGTTVTGTGSFILNSSLAAAAGTFKGTAVVDNITGGVGADTISAGAGNDTITGGLGADSITSGGGNDTIVLTEATSSADKIVFESTASANGIDTITGFITGSDILDLNPLTTSTAVTAVTGSLTATADKVYYLQTATAGNADTAAAVATAVTGAATWTAAAAAAYIVINDDNSSAIYQWTDTAGTAGVQAGELVLIATVDARLASTADIIFA
jgi:Ca2+-binding RTX toxin-like protein